MFDKHYRNTAVFFGGGVKIAGQAHGTDCEAPCPSCSSWPRFLTSVEHVVFEELKEDTVRGEHFVSRPSTWTLTGVRRLFRIVAEIENLPGPPPEFNNSADDHAVR
ncbi:hypothetical protein PUN28_017319 [Cardiocondyla obscurior]|uniref:Uncharacterized protein n=1 Tax=Cardiocondyla obscurior TaxID=286306 RepID=A0AAW2EMZ2_9HYME